MSDQKPQRLFLIPDYESDVDETDSYWGNVFTDNPGQGPLAEMANSFWAVPESAYNALALRLKAAKTEVKQVESVCAQVGHQLTREKEITAMLREALIEACSCGRVHAGWCPQCKAVAREKEMRRKEK